MTKENPLNGAQRSFMITIVDITGNKKLFKDFVNFPNKLYKGVPYYVPYLYGDEMILINPKKNAAYRDCKPKYFLAYRDGKIAGRIAALVHYTFNDKVNEKRVRFNRLDMIDDVEVTRALLDAVEGFARSEGMDTVHGPFGFNDMDREGYNVFGFEEIATLASNYNYEYYDRLIKSCGYEKENDWIEFELHVPPKSDPRVQRLLRLSEIVKKRYGLTVLKFKSMKRLLAVRAKDFFDLYFEAYHELPGFIPFNDDLKKQMLKSFKLVLKPDFVPIVADKNGKLAAFGLMFPDITEILRDSGGKMTIPAIVKMLKMIKRPRDKVELGLIGVGTDWKMKGVNAVIIAEIIEQLYKYGIKKIETNLNAETNKQIIAMWDNLDKRQHKRKRCVVKYL
jgi:hypothetical protein